MNALTEDREKRHRHRLVYGRWRRGELLIAQQKEVKSKRRNLEEQLDKWWVDERSQ